MGILDKLLGKGKTNDGLRNESPVTETLFDVETLSVDVKDALVEIALANPGEEFGDRARNIHALSKMQADALVIKLNAMTEDTPLAVSAAPALAGLVFAMSQAEAYAFKSDPFSLAGAPSHIQASWLETVKAVLHDEARAPANALAAYRQLHGLEP